MELFFHHFTKPKNYLFPVHETPSRTPKKTTWLPKLITWDRIDALYAQEPWEALRQHPTPISFEITGWFQSLVELYQDFEDHHRQALWESTHVLPITSDQRKTDPDLANFCKERKQRRSRSGHRWKNVLRFILQGMISGQCDLDILLDPYFLHFPRATDKKMWYPGLGSKSRSIPDLATALSMLDFAEPWRNQFRSAIVNHPGSSIPRLIGKFVVK